ncbi:hypothetical protein BCR34DRAFT_565692 [Clohesyomyces aquaticus]|uniref:Zn(2)-C6 fungal-type domain-containing protein n=1 Tax=Clohesyomyces aquaticus TaxID=1231657 RepID=A0A1Y1ZLK2_9PLEO|nr:hypothetical protein BCR34DRAFT_565692 [Clohesyomyces aquaticus]
MSGIASTPIVSYRRREKPQLSCHACRRRKVRCDRLHPCSNCTSRGQGSSCIFTNAHGNTLQGGNGRTVNPKPDDGPGATVISDIATIPGNAANMKSRIDQLESLVLNLMHQNVPTSHPSPLQELDLVSPSQRDHPPTNSEIQYPVSPSPSDYGRISIRQSRPSYVNSSHWAAILDSISELRNHLAQDEDNSHQIHDSVRPQTRFPKPQLLYSGITYETPVSIIKSLPSRAVVDRLISRYFNLLDIAPGVVHSTQFLREYEEFWKAPDNAPVMWVGLLFSMMCLSTQLQQMSLSPGDSARAQSLPAEDAVNLYRTKTIQCLLLGHYTKGGRYTLETLILYFLTECFNLKDMEIGIWVLVGTIVQIAMHMGYHRDAKHFPNISPFAGEMRRRVWAMIVQLDIGVSTQLGLPRMVKERQTDTAEPRNLHDSDFDESVVDLPRSRPETEVTPTLYVLAKLRLLSVGAKVADVATEPRTHSYADILELDRKVQEAQAGIPSSLKWTGLGASLNVSSQTIIQRIWLEVIVQQLKIVLHKKFLDPIRIQEQYRSSRNACIDAAMKILDLQRIVDEEIQADGLLYQSRWRVSSAFSNDFLLATSILCYCLQAYIERERSPSMSSGNTDLEPMEMDKIRILLRTAQGIWARQCAESKEARKAVSALQYVLGNFGGGAEDHVLDGVLSPPTPSAAVSYFPDFTSSYDFLGPDLESESSGWPAFASDSNGEIERWGRTSGFQQMNLSS